MHKESLGEWDYVTIALTMVISVLIGLYFRFTGNRQKTTTEFLMAGKNMGRLPVVFSLVVTKLSAIAIIGEPTDIYLYGTQRCIGYIFIFVGSLVDAYVFLPVYFAVGASTIYELLNMSVVIYTPAIALSAVTEINPEYSVVLIGVVCILLSSLGGLKAVMWADVFQAVMMYACLIALLSQCLYEAGGFKEVYRAAYDGGRMDFFNFTGDFRIPYTFWNSLSYGVQFGVAHCVNQFEVQRLLAVRNLKISQSAALWSSIPSFVMAFLTTTVGLALYAVFRNCDPLNEKSGIGLTKADQVVPYYIVSRLIGYPGLVGLCISGILCASLSSLSSALNSLSTVFVEDFVNASFTKRSKPSALKLNILAKALVIMHGIAIIGLTFMTSRFKSVLQAVVVLDGMVLGPSLGVYILGVFTKRSNELGVLIGLTTAAFFSIWFGLGTSLFGNTYEGLPFHNKDCIPNQWNATVYSYSSPYLKSETTNSTLSVDMKRYFPMYGISYIWTYCIGAALTIIIGYTASRIIDCQKKPAPVDPKLLCPLVKSRHSQIPEEHDIILKPSGRSSTSS
ncbi:unnamed protein product [Larinioides sclopetarius]|uniref:Sodium-dependent multivitamin transporter n=1 Tax=Larinioides sclopetarius TaxID=280406 RepID=A0AAV1Z7R9_9ARAC